MHTAVIKKDLSPADQEILALLNNEHRNFSPGKKVYIYQETFKKEDRIIGAFPEDGNIAGEIAPLPLSFLEISGRTKDLIERMMR